MVGTPPGFHEDEFNAGILSAMEVGLPPRPADRPTFYFPAQVANIVPADEGQVPFDPAARPVRTSRAGMQVACAVEYLDAAGVVVDMGVVTPSKVVLTFLDDAYQKVKGFSHVTCGGDRYLYRRTPPPLGMGTATVWTVICVAEDES